MTLGALFPTVRIYQVISLKFMRTSLISFLTGLVIIAPGLAQADRHCSLGIGFIEVAVAELNNTSETKDTCSETQDKVSDWLTTIVEDFEVCGCALPNSVLTEARRSAQLPCDESGQLQLEILNQLDQVAKTACGY